MYAMTTRITKYTKFQIHIDFNSYKFNTPYIFGLGLPLHIIRAANTQFCRLYEVRLHFEFNAEIKEDKWADVYSN